MCGREPSCEASPIGCHVAYAGHASDLGEAWRSLVTDGSQLVDHLLGRHVLVLSGGLSRARDGRMFESLSSPLVNH
jgi:hypothetical protein